MVAQLRTRTRLTIIHRNSLGLPHRGNIVVFVPLGDLEVTVNDVTVVGDPGGVTLGDKGGVTFGDSGGVTLGDSGEITLGETGGATLGDVTQGSDFLNWLSG